MSDEVLVERRNGVQIITINRPEAKNALNQAVGEGIAAAVGARMLDADPLTAAATVAAEVSAAP